MQRSILYHGLYMEHFMASYEPWSWFTHTTSPWRRNVGRVEEIVVENNLVCLLTFGDTHTNEAEKVDRVRRRWWYFEEFDDLPGPTCVDSCPRHPCRNTRFPHPLRSFVWHPTMRIWGWWRSFDARVFPSSDGPPGRVFGVGYAGCSLFMCFFCFFVQVW